MSPAEALGVWVRLGAMMQDADPDGFSALVERAEEIAGLRDKRSRDKRRGLRVINGGAR